MAFSSLLMLDQSAWSVILGLLDPSDLPRLMLVGNQQLLARLKSSVRELTLEWRSSRYIDMESVLSPVSLFPNVTRLYFRQIGCTVRSWTPADWTLLPSQLTSLRLSFAGAPLLFLSQERTDLALPQLLHLDLEETTTLRIDQSPTGKLGLLHLPSSLLSLRIHRDPETSLVVDELAHLPPGLQSLELEFTPILVGQSRLQLTHPVDLPPMPATLRRLSLRDASSSHWIIRSKELPSTLESLEFDSASSAPCSALLLQDGQSVRHCSTLYFDGAETHLPNLRYLRLKTATIAADLMMNCIPRSVTAVDLLLCPPTRESPECAAFIDFIAQRLISYRSVPTSQPWFDWDVNFNPSRPSMLKSLSLASNRQIELPESIEDLMYESSCSGNPIMPPKGVKTLHVHCNFPIGILLSSPLPHLQELILSTTCLYDGPDPTFDWLSALPDSLTSISASMEGGVLSILFSLMRATDRLQNLAFITSDMIIDASYAFQGIPPQLKDLTVTINLEQGRTIPPSILASLKASHLRKLAITLISHLESWNTLKIVHDIMASLPETLEHFELIGNVPVLPWTVNLPPMLKHLKIRCDAWRSVNSERLIFGNDPVPPRTRFPDSLTRLHTFYALKVPLESLPPYLSEYICTHNTEEPYFASRVAPSSSNNSGPKGAARTLCA